MFEHREFHKQESNIRIGKLRIFNEELYAFPLSCQSLFEFLFLLRAFQRVIFVLNAH